MKNHPTLWTLKEKKFTPINKQAALITRKAADCFLPPEPGPKFELTFAQKLEIERVERRLKIERLEKENAERDKEIQAKKAAHRDEQRKKLESKTIKNRWMLKHIRTLNKLRGLPRPTKQEVESAKRKAPGYGNKLYSLTNSHCASSAPDPQ